ncbi:MAG: exodeoxyribonuclease VII small subunit [Planctomycetota bacterium]|nr:MAG: exodeoxyribonuclease VII small subunit [Planctomycetota bacterium]
MATKRKTTEPSFAEARERLDAILEELERDSADVDMLAARIKEASELIRFCRERLSATRQDVQKVVAELAVDPAEGGAPGGSAEAEPQQPGETGDLPF